MKTELYCQDGKILAFDRTVDAQGVAFARRSGKPLYEIKGKGQQTLEITFNIERAKNLFNTLSGVRCFEIVAGFKRDVTDLVRA